MSPMKGTITFRHYPGLHLMRGTLYLFYYLFIRYTTILLFQAHNYRRQGYSIGNDELILLFPFVRFIVLPRKSNKLARHYHKSLAISVVRRKKVLMLSKYVSECVIWRNLRKDEMRFQTALIVDKSLVVKASR